jgi:hypothetical protein
MLRRILYSLALLSLLGAAPSSGQQPPSPQPGPAELEELVRTAGLRASEYKAKFKDLTADEDKQVEEYDSEGKVKRRRRIVSDLIIYQSQLDASETAEYRYAREVDGVPVAKREEKLVNLFKKLSKADSVKKELDRINNESRRHDFGFSVYNETLNQGLPLHEKFRGVFRFTAVGREQVNGREVIVLQYQQVAQTPEIRFDISAPSMLKGAETLFRGRLWLDAETKQLWREVREMTLRHPSLTEPLVLFRYEFDYVASRFGILTPQRIVVSAFTRGGRNPDKSLTLMLGWKNTFSYSGFRRFDTATPDASLEPAAKP